MDYQEYTKRIDLLQEYKQINLLMTFDFSQGLEHIDLVDEFVESEIDSSIEEIISVELFDSNLN